MLWLFHMLLIQGTAIKEGDSCGTPGYLNNFTFHQHRYIQGYNLQMYEDVSSNKEILRATCEEYCLNNTLCTSYEIDFVYDDCYISNYNMYDIALRTWNIYDFYNRVYDCGCPSDQGANVINSYTSTTDGSTLNISCSFGSKNDALPATLTCTSDGWGLSANTYSCIVYCSRPANGANSTHNGTLEEYNVGDIVIYTCDTGYVNLDTKETDAFIHCQNDGTWEAVPICIIDCGPPENIQNAVVTSGDIFTPGQSVEYTCNSGFLMSDTKLKLKTITCQDDGMWENYPSCIVNCGAPPTVQNAFSPSGSIYIPGDDTTITCDPSFVVVHTKQSKATITCNNNGNWDQNPMCTNDCGPPPAIPNSTNNASSTVYVPSEQVTYTCNNNYIMLGSLQSQAAITCQNNGRWTDTPICIVTCGSPEPLQQATVTTGNVFTPGQTVTYTCTSGYVISETKTSRRSIVCTNNGEWETKPSCVVNCGAPPIVQNAFLPSGSIYIPGDDVTITCDPSYVVVGTKQSKATITCNKNGNWDQNPMCIKDCGPPPAIPHSTNNASGTVYVPNEKVTYTCNKNYIMLGSLQSQAAVTCQNNGRWTDTPICIANCGTPPSVQHATKSNQGSIFTPGDYISWTCDDRYVVQATNIVSENVMCKGDGTWTTKPNCVAYCGEPPDVDHAQVQGTGSQQGDSRTYTCTEGYTMVGSAVVQCQSNSVWEETPICPADCGDPPVLSKGHLTGTGNLENDTRNAMCGNGYVLEGRSIIKCQMNGQWEDLPQCTATEVHRFKQSMFGAEKSPISQQTGIAMTFAIVFGLLLIGIGFVYCYNVCKQKQKDGENKQNKSSKHSSKESGQFHINGSFNASAEDNLYLPAGHAYKTDRSWREIFY